jgi:hypothetical protein
MIDMSSCVRCKNTILGETKEHLERCARAQLLEEAMQYFEEQGVETLTLEQAKLLASFLMDWSLSGDLLGWYVLSDPQDW